MRKRIVFDVDDVISTHINRDYKNAIPHVEVINKINRLYAKGFEIVLNTSRGIVSCEGDINLIENRNRKTLEDWLEKHNVKYHELVFGKPIADMYVDDKCMNVRDFMKQEFYELNGGSGKDIYRIGDLVKKELSPEKVQRVKEWENIASNVCNTPKITSSLYNCIYMEYIDGINLSEAGGTTLFISLNELLHIINKFKENKLSGFDLSKHIEILNDNLGYDKTIDKKINILTPLLLEKRDMLNKNATFCHGDLTLSNVILENVTNSLYLIDCEMDSEASSYLLDYAKLYMSLLGYERRFGLLHSTNNLSLYKTFMEEKMLLNGIYDIVVLLTYMYILRLTRYKKDYEYSIILQMLNILEAENEHLFKG